MGGNEKAGKFFQIGYIHFSKRPRSTFGAIKTKIKEWFVYEYLHLTSMYLEWTLKMTFWRQLLQDKIRGVIHGIIAQ